MSLGLAGVQGAGREIEPSVRSHDGEIFGGVVATPQPQGAWPLAPGRLDEIGRARVAWHGVHPLPPWPLAPWTWRAAKRRRRVPPVPVRLGLGLG